MDPLSTYAKSSNSSPTTSTHSRERSSTTSYGDSYVYTGPLTPQYYEIQAKLANEGPKPGLAQTDGSNAAASSSSSSSTNDPSLTSSPSIEVVPATTQYQFKVMLLGDSGVGKNVLSRRLISILCSVGKTCLLVRFKDGTFLAGSFIATVGIDFRNKLVTLGDKKIKLQIFDTVMTRARAFVLLDQCVSSFRLVKSVFAP